MANRLLGDEIVGAGKRARRSEGRLRARRDEAVAEGRDVEPTLAGRDAAAGRSGRDRAIEHALDLAGEAVERTEQTREYRTIALSQTARRRGLRGAAEIAERMNEVLNTQAEAGWRYLRAETTTITTPYGLFSSRSETYMLLVFERTTAPEAPARQPLALAPPPKLEASPLDIDGKARRRRRAGGPTLHQR